MIDVGFWEIAMIGVLALIILGPERLPRVAQTAGLWIGKARRMMRELKTDMQTEIDNSDLKGVGDQIREAKANFESQVNTAQKDANDQTASVDKAIADALNKPLTPTAKQTVKNKVIKKKVTKKATTLKTSTKKKKPKKIASKKVGTKSKPQTKNTRHKKASKPTV